MSILRWIVLACLLTAASAIAGEADWPEFRGPGQQGHAPPSATPPTTWSEKQNLRWKTAIPGQGWSSPVVLGDQVWMTTALDDGRSLRAVCVDRDSGSIVHDVEVFHVKNPQGKNPFNSYASPSPVAEEGRVYVCFGTHGSAALDARTARVLWRNDELRLDHKEGPGSSPIIYRDLFILHCDGTDVQYIVALDKHTGAIRWKTPRSFDFNAARIPGEIRKAYCTPIVVSVGGRDQIISVGSRRVYGYDPVTGQELWWADHPGFSNVPRPVFRDGVAYVCTGYMKPELWAIRVDGARGDLTRTHVLWKQRRGISSKPSNLLVGDAIYVVSDGGIVSCRDIKTGDSFWEERIGEAYSASPPLAGGLIYLFDEKGQGTVIRPGRTLEIVATNRLDEGCLATPAFSGKAIFIRTTGHLYRVEQ